MTAARTGQRARAHRALLPAARGYARIGTLAVLALSLAAGLAVVRSHGAAGSPRAPAAPLRVVGVVPADGARDVPGAAPVTVTFSAPLRRGATPPTLSPAVPGSWAQPSPTTMVFTPTGAQVPSTDVHLTVPAGIPDRAGGALAAPFTASWTTAAGSTGRLQQLLAELGYLPVSFTPAQAEPADTGGLARSAYAPVAGRFAWRYDGVPSSLRALWQPASRTVVTQGAVMSFEHDHGLTADGLAGPKVWGALIAATAAGEHAHHAYSYVVARRDVRPQSLLVWEHGQVVASSAMNSGVAAAPTPLGTWPVYSRLASQTMRGTNPDGSHYVDPGVPWISYFKGGDAIHGFARRHYGTPQSVGCLELPVSEAKAIWPMLQIGTLVTVARS